MSLLDALKRKNSGPSNAAFLFEKFLQSRDEGDDAQAFEYVKESMELGYLPAIGEYGNLLMMGVYDDDGEAIQEEDEETGMQYELQAADGGYLPSMVRVGFHYFQGCGTEPDIDEAARYWEMAVEKGSPEAKLKLAQLYIMGIGEDQDYAEGMRLLDEAIRELPQTPESDHYLNDPEWNLGEARFWKGMLYYYGMGQRLNRYTAMELFKEAQEGFPVADNVVEEGEDPREAMYGYDYPYDQASWWEIYVESEDEDEEFPYEEEEDKYEDFSEEEEELAHDAMMGDVESLVKIADMILQWDGYMSLLDIYMSKDPEWEELRGEAYDLWRNEEYQEAAEAFFVPACHGNTDAMLMAGRSWFEYWNSGDGEDIPCWTKAFEWYLKGACNLNENAMYYLGEAYYMGRVPDEEGEINLQPNYDAAAFWFRKAAYHWENVNPRHCHADAANYLGTMYDDGLIGGKKDPAKAVECYRRATELSDRTLAWYNLGRAYEYGLGVPRDIRKARECYSKIASFNDAAKEAMKKIDIRY